MKTVGLPSSVKVKTMSRGMRQRLGIAAVLVNNPDVILLDEPTSALDPSGRNDVKNILMKLKNEGKTIILSTHILADMDSICDRAGFLNGGVIAREVDVAEMTKNSEEMIVGFKTEPDLKLMYQYVKKIFIADPLTVKLSIDQENRSESQKKIFEALAAVPQEISYVNTVKISLDDIFREVCV